MASVTVVAFGAGIGQAGRWHPVLGEACAARTVFGWARVAEGVEMGVPTVQSHLCTQVFNDGRGV
jgi:hypothetical protein